MAEAQLILNLIKQKVHKIDVVVHSRSLRITVEIYANDRPSYEEIMKALRSLVNLDVATLSQVIDTAKKVVPQGQAGQPGEPKK